MIYYQSQYETAKTSASELGSVPLKQSFCKTSDYSVEARWIPKNNIAVPISSSLFCTELDIIYLASRQE